MLKVGELASLLHEALLNMNIVAELNSSLGRKNRGRLPDNYWINLMSDEGLDCEILKLGARDWQKGKVRIEIHLEFCPDEPEIEETPPIVPAEPKESESPLDDLRRQLNLDR